MTSRQSTAKATTETAGAPGNPARTRLAFVAATASLTAGFAASSSPIPLYTTYRAENGFSSADLSLTVVAYFLGTITALLVLGRLSNHLGRRPVAIATLALLAAGSAVLLNVDSIAVLILGRLLMGFGAGLASSTLTSYIVDAAPDHPAWLASVASSQAPMLGLTLGAIGSGTLVQYGPWPRTFTYTIAIALLACCAALIALSPETKAPIPGALASLRPRVQVPRRARPLLPVAAAVLLATWATGAYYQAFVPTLTADQLGSRNALVLGLVFSAYMAPSLVGAPLGGRFAAATAQRIGMVIFLTGMVGVVAALTTDTLALFIVGSVIAGTGQGLAVSATIRGLLHGSTLADRSPLFAAIYLLSYSGAAIPSLISGQLSDSFSLTQITLGYGALAALATVVTLLRAGK